MNKELSGRIPLRIVGRITGVTGGSIVATFPQASVGDLCWLCDRTGKTIKGQIVSFQSNVFSLALFEEADGLSPGLAVCTEGASLAIPVGAGLLGRVVNALGEPIDEDHRMPLVDELRSLRHVPPSPLTRPLIDTALDTGVRAIDGFCTLGVGQRMGVFASAGVGKSTLLAMIASCAAVDVIVIALVGERSREVREFIEETLGESGLQRSVLVVATSDDSSLMRQTAPYTATTIAEYFRDQGKNVLLVVDSLTRMARAIRETSLSAGELPVRHGYTNSVYTELPKLIERAGRSSLGSITALYTVLTNQEEDIDPLADEIKSLLDGHIVLRSEIASLGVLPAIDITRSISRLFPRLHNPAHLAAARQVTYAVNRLLKERHIVLLGGVPDAELSQILEHQSTILSCIKQERHEVCGAASIRTAISDVCTTLSR